MSDEQLRTLAARFKTITEGELALLCNVELSTCEAWRKRGQGPDYIRAGNSILYADEAVERWLLGRERCHESKGKAAL